ncbi:MAG TPA: flagellar motor protein MotB [Bryobacteraceae bacterium]|jgi:chemotaxis protein MotB|nr:flagellar motor protein MotB [Bryobacteraceae bacterium]
MKRARRAPLHNRERWLVSYADFVTLLFALFVVLFAASQTKHQASDISASIEKALTGHSAKTRAKSTTIPAMPTAAPEPEKQKKPDDSPDTSLEQSLAYLKTDLKEEIDSGKLRLSLEHRGLVISLDTGAFFRLGDDEVSHSAGSTMDKLATFLGRIPNALRLEGHTDSLPIRTERFRSNWELSAARSIGMLRLLHEKYGISAQRMAIVGYADTEAIESNSTAEGREKNRRVDIVVLTDKSRDAAQPASSLNHTT